MDIRYSKKFQKQLRKSPQKIGKIFVERLELFIKDQDNPILRCHILKGEMSGLYSINITGDWRAIYQEIDGVILFVAIGTHSQLYK